MSDQMWARIVNTTWNEYGLQLDARCRVEPPPDMSFTLPILLILVVYTVVFIIALVGNGTMFLILCRNQLVKVRRVHSLLLHMNIAHLMVTFFYMPKEVLHNYMIAWNGGDFLCRTCKFFDVFGIALSANVLICISLDRFYSIFFPLYAMKARRSVQQMVVIAWIVSFVTSAPQFYLFRTTSHPCYPWFSQCVARNFIKEIPNVVVYWYSIVNIIQVYFAPLLVTVVCYSLILWKISHKNCGKNENEKGGLLRRNGGDNLQRARSRTLRMTFVVVSAFLFCWTPYAVIMFLHFTTNKHWIPKEVRKFIYAFAVFNSALSPYLYGYFSFDLKKEIKLLLNCSTRNAVSERFISYSSTLHTGGSRVRNSTRMRKRSQSAQNISQEGIPIALLATDHADDVLKRSGLGSYSDLFRPFSDVSFSLRDPFGNPPTPGKASLDFRDLRKQGYLLSLTVLPPTIHEALLKCTTLEESEQKFERYFSRFVEPCEYETFRTYLACVFVVSAAEDQPMGELSKLIQLQHTQQHGSGSEGNLLAPSHCAPPKWRTPNTLKHYLLVHDSRKDDEARTQDIYKQMCATYGADSCQLLRIGNGDGSGLIDVWREASEEAEILSRGLARARNALLTKGAEEKKNQPTVISTISPGYILPETRSDDSLVSPAPFQPAIQPNVSTADREATAKMLQEFTDRNLIPFVERLMRQLNEAIGQRRGIPRSITANMKKWFAAPAATNTASTSYTNESVEMQSRRLADLLFEFGLYEKAHAQYQSVKKDFAGDNAWLHNAAALDMSAYSYFLSNPSMPTKGFPVHYFENAIGHFLTNSATVSYTCALRCALQAVEVLQKLEMNVQAALLLSRLTELKFDHFVAVILGYATMAFGEANMRRKMAFYRVLAGNRFLKAGLSHLATTAYISALPCYFERNWDYAEDHLAKSVAKDGRDGKVALACATRLLRPADHQNAQQQSEHFAIFAGLVKTFGLDAQERIQLQLPLIDVQSTTVICGERPSSADVTAELARSSRDDPEEHPWDDIQRAAFYTLAGPSSAFRSLCVVSNHMTDNTLTRYTPAGERFRVILNVKNPLGTPLTVRKLRLGVSDVEFHEGIPPALNPFLECHTVDEVNLQPSGSTTVELWLRPLFELASFRVSEVQLDLDAGDGQTMVKARIPLVLKGPRLNKTLEHRSAVTYANDYRLSPKVSRTSWPLLDVQMERPFPEFVYCGQALRISFKLENISDEPISGVAMSTDGTDSVTGGLFDENGAKQYQGPQRSDNNGDVRVIPLPGLALAKGQSRRIFVDIRVPQEPSNTTTALLLFYRGSNGAFREQRILVPLRCKTLFAAQAILLAPAYGLLTLEMRNTMGASDAALARIEIGRISAHLVQLNGSGSLTESPNALSLRPVRMRGSQLDSGQADSLPVNVTGSQAGYGSALWLSQEFADCPSFPLPRWFLANSPSYRPSLLIAILWKASVVDNQGQVISLIGETLVADPFARANLRVPGIQWPLEDTAPDRPPGVYITVASVAKVEHDFERNRLCQFPVDIRVHNDENECIGVYFKFLPKYNMPLTPPLPLDSRQQWWLNFEQWDVPNVASHTVETTRVYVRVGQPSVFDILGNQLQAIAKLSTGVEYPVSVPVVHAMVTGILN
ncbi:unnamed protein product, partial [Mesorhabditis spiculigera]